MDPEILELWRRMKVVVRFGVPPLPQQAERIWGHVVYRELSYCLCNSNCQCDIYRPCIYSYIFTWRFPCEFYPPAQYILIYFPTCSLTSVFVYFV